MVIEVKRKWPRSKYIIGRLYIDGAFLCHSMEPPHHGAHPCIPVGTYKVTMYPSAKFKGLRPLINDVKGRSGILIHEGNYPSQTLGCVLVGNNTSVGMLTSSKAMLQKIMDKIVASGETTITITECF